MKKELLCLFIVLSSFGLKAQDITLRFSANHTCTHVPLDSIWVENITQGGKMVLFYPDTVISFVLTNTEGLEHNFNNLFVSQNYPNPFSATTYIDVFIPQADVLSLKVIDLRGSLVATYSGFKEQGSHQFSFTAGRENTYILMVQTGLSFEKKIMLQFENKSSGSSEIRYNGRISGLNAQTKSTYLDFSYEIGDNLKFTGYVTNSLGDVDYELINDTPTDDTDYVFEIANALPPNPSSIEGDDVLCENQSGLIYETDYFEGVDYSWTFPVDWTIIGGQGTHSVMISVGSASGNITVFTENNCGIGNEVVFPVSVIEASLPVLSTAEITQITSTSAVSGGNIASDGCAAIIARGIVWDTSPNPTLENNEGFTSNGEGIDEFVSEITGLAPETTYYVRGYATNISGTGYGQQEEFTTEESGGSYWEPGEGVTDIDDNFYPSAIIGTQEWMAENLKTTKYRNGTPIAYPGTDNTAWENNTTGAYAWFANDPSWKNSYGALYNWHAVINSNGLCPTGWHVPSDAEWTVLVNYVVSKGFPNEYDNSNGAGNALKSCQQVSSPLGENCNTSEHPRWDSDITHYGMDEFGFSGLPGGYRLTNGIYYGIGVGSFWRSATGYTETLSWTHSLANNYGHLYRGLYGNGDGFSVRCVRDASQIPTVITAETNNITDTTAISGGTVTGDGSSIVTARGVVWSTSPGPSIENNEGFTTDNNGLGEFASEITGLVPETTYYVRAYATNSSGTGYGQQEEFTTEESGASYWEPGEGVTDIDDNFYPSVIIGTQEWMAENLKTTNYRNGTPIEYPGTDNTAWQNNTTGAYAWFENDIAWKDSYGALYNWHAVNSSNGLCPTGWHVPSDAEWTVLVNYVVSKGFPNESSNPNGAGNALKSCRQVSSPLSGSCDTPEHPRWDSDITHYGMDEFGFSGLPGGFRYSSGSWYFMGQTGYWWASNIYSTTKGWQRSLYYYYGYLLRSPENKDHGASVRCLRDSE